LGILAYWAIGWALAFGPNPYASLDPFFGFSQFFINGLQDYAKFFFQFVFAATASVRMEDNINSASLKFAPPFSDNHFWGRCGASGICLFPHLLNHDYR
jgi:hypothetical protein